MISFRAYIPRARRAPLSALCLAATLFLGGCKTKEVDDARLYRMGERVQIGPLIYNVLEATWKTELGDGPTGRLPKQRFLMLRVTITNSGGDVRNVPFLNLEDTKGQGTLEESEAAGVPDWLGLIRTMKPADTVDGRILFDVAPGSYRLRVTDAGETGSEKSALIEIPLEMENPVAPAPQASGR